LRGDYIVKKDVTTKLKVLLGEVKCASETAHKDAESALRRKDTESYNYEIGQHDAYEWLKTHLDKIIKSK
jgi:hypothetical protein